MIRNHCGPFIPTFGLNPFLRLIDSRNRPGFLRSLFFDLVEAGFTRKPISLRRWNHDSAVFRQRLDFTCVEHPVAPSLLAAKKGGEFGWRKRLFVCHLAFS